MLSRIWSRMKNRTYRHSYASAQASVHRAAQITAMRENRGWTQGKLAKEAGMAQARISLLEDPSYESVSISTLQRIAAAFDVVLLVRYVSFKEFVSWTDRLRDSEFAVEAFDAKWTEPEAAKIELPHDFLRLLEAGDDRNADFGESALDAIGGTLTQTDERKSGRRAAWN